MKIKQPKSYKYAQRAYNINKKMINPKVEQEHKHDMSKSGYCEEHGTAWFIGCEKVEQDPLMDHLMTKHAKAWKKLAEVEQEPTCKCDPTGDLIWTDPKCPVHQPKTEPTTDPNINNNWERCQPKTEGRETVSHRNGDRETVIHNKGYDCGLDECTEGRECFVCKEEESGVCNYHLSSPKQAEGRECDSDCRDERVKRVYCRHGLTSSILSSPKQDTLQNECGCNFGCFCKGCCDDRKCQCYAGGQVSSPKQDTWEEKLFEIAYEQEWHLAPYELKELKDFIRSELQKQRQIYEEFIIHLPGTRVGNTSYIHIPRKEVIKKLDELEEKE